MSATPEATTPPPLEVRSILGDVRDRIRSGDLGTLPVFFALALIVVFFQLKNSNYLSAGNFNNLIVQMAGEALIAMGVVFVLLLGEIDLSAGFVSGIGGVLMAEFLLQGGSFHLPFWSIGGFAITPYIAVILAVAGGCLIGAVQGTIVAVVGVPSFVVTLAGLLIWQGVLLQIIGDGGTVVIQDQTIVNASNYFMAPVYAWIFAVIAIVAYALTTFMKERRRPTADSRARNYAIARVVFMALVTVGIVSWSLSEKLRIGGGTRGFPVVLIILVLFLLAWTYISDRTVFGRHVYAVGGNAEAARRAGINVTRIRILVFTIGSGMAAVGGIILASQLASVSPASGGNSTLLDVIGAAVIGGTSLFGGRGNVKSAVLGALVVNAVANGIALVGYSSAIQYIVTGLILLAAVTVDTVSRRRLAAAGR
ncbi:MAG TPA: sugar ABC transporter permease [Solirubrobacteraceae bacterium]|jgi:D-xylose transport system permease protein|nr:sugar ABC transporter permease [Solirubrobacteraceae bacterium]